jgi:hypothetical protein
MTCPKALILKKNNIQNHQPVSIYFKPLNLRLQKIPARPGFFFEKVRNGLENGRYQILNFNVLCYFKNLDSTDIRGAVLSIWVQTNPSAFTFCVPGRFVLRAITDLHSLCRKHPENPGVFDTASEFDKSCRPSGQLSVGAQINSVFFRRHMKPDGPVSYAFEKYA